MTFWNLIQANLAVDIFCIGFIIFLLVKTRKMNKKINALEEKVNLTIKNPLAAKRQLKKQQ
jgi:hypothetical protein